jgi:hypothetical protein
MIPEEKLLQLHDALHEAVLENAKEDSESKSCLVCITGIVDGCKSAVTGSKEDLIHAMLAAYGGNPEFKDIIETFIEILPRFKQKVRMIPVPFTPGAGKAN